MLKRDFSTNLTRFDQTKTKKHIGGTLVKYDNKVLAVGGGQALVEQINDTQIWTEHSAMSPVNTFQGTFYGQTWLSGFTAISLETSLFIFGRFHLLK